MAQAFPGSQTLRPGSKDAAGAGTRVAALQAQLQRLQVLQPGEAVTVGLYDSSTELAVRRLQWFAGHVPGALSAAGSFVPRPRTRLAVDGVVGPRTRRLIQAFMDQDWAAAGLLVKLHFTHLRHTQANAGFTALLDGNPDLGLCEAEFAGVMAALDAKAQRLGIFVFVNQLFRVEGGSLAGTIVPPASYSSHRIGRAVDLQLGTSAVPSTGSNPQASTHIMNAAPGTAYARFRQHAKGALKCRYGGDFDPVDPPHFDRQVLPAGSQTWHMHHYFNQLQYRQALVHPGAIPHADLNPAAAPAPGGVP